MSSSHIVRKNEDQAKHDDIVDDVLHLDVNASSAEKKLQEDNDCDALPSGTGDKKLERAVKWKARSLRRGGKLPTTEKDVTKAGVVYLGHIPHGFYEKEMKGYFSQFGEVSRIRLSRSKKTARSRGYAFIEFVDEEVAIIAAKSMDGYLMHGQSLVAKFVAPEKVHPDTFKGANHNFRQVPWSAVERRGMISRAKDPLKMAARSRRIRKVLKDKKATLAKKGIKYEFPQVRNDVKLACT